MLSRAASAAACAALLLAGCAERERESFAASTSAQPAMVSSWEVGSWFSYHVELQDDEFDVTVVVDEVREDGYHLGTNLSVGFFGLPWSGNLTRDRNPVVSGEEWPLFRFPLADGAEWSYRVMGHDATTRVAKGSDGFAFEAESWGRTFARYDHVGDAGWFSRFEIVEPTDGRVLLRATLLEFGDAFEGSYFVERPILERTVWYPVLPGAAAIAVPAGARHVRAFVTAEADAGAVVGELRDEDGRLVARASALGRGSATDIAVLRAPEGAVLMLHHLGAGAGALRVELSGVFETR